MSEWSIFIAKPSLILTWISPLRLTWNSRKAQGMQNHSPLFLACLGPIHLGQRKVMLEKDPRWQPIASIFLKFVRLGLIWELSDKGIYTDKNMTIRMWQPRFTAQFCPSPLWVLVLVFPANMEIIITPPLSRRMLWWMHRTTHCLKKMSSKPLRMKAEVPHRGAHGGRNAEAAPSWPAESFLGADKCPCPHSLCSALTAPKPCSSQSSVHAHSQFLTLTCLFNSRL